MGKIYTDTIGVEIWIAMDQNVEAATVHNFLVRKPQSGETIWIANILAPNILRYVTGVNDLDEEGTYFIHPVLTIGGLSGHGTSVSFNVYKKWR